jgi:putative transposase
MFRISRFHELMKPVSRDQFARLVEQHGSDKHCKGFRSWDQLIAMVYAQLSGASSLRQIQAGYNSQLTQHYHLGSGPVRRSTLSDANRLRDPAVFAACASGLMAAASRQLRQSAKALLLLLDSTSISLTGPGFDPWTQPTRTRNTQGIKLHTVCAHHGQYGAVPLQARISAANVNDISVARELPLQPGACYVFDKGYCDYGWWHTIAAAGACFVTRFKRNAALTVLSVRPLTAPVDAQAQAEQALQPGQVLADEIVCFKHTHPRGGRPANPYTQPLRRVTVARAPHQHPLVLATNDMDSTAEQIAQRYRQRWAIELFFKWIKQHLRITRFVGRSENAVKIQLLTALIAYLLVALLHKASQTAQTPWLFLAQLRATLFERPALQAHYYRRRKERAAILQALQPDLFS